MNFWTKFNIFGSFGFVFYSYLSIHAWVYSRDTPILPQNKYVNKSINLDEKITVPILSLDKYVNEFSEQNSQVSFGSFGIVSKVMP